LKQVRFAPSAETDLESIGDYIAMENPRRAYTFVQEIRNRCEKLSQFPEQARRLIERRDDIRILTFKNYVILYSNSRDGVMIIRIVHGARDLIPIIEELTSMD
jgi:toxin ParE1/3/4